jgi:stage II sporulation protein D
MSPAIALIALLLGSGAVKTTEPPGVSADSIRVILFALESPDAIEVRSDGPITVDGRRLSGHGAVASRLRVAAAGSLLELDGSTRTHLSLAGGTRPMVIRSGTRRRVTSGRIEISASGGVLRIVAHLPLRDYLAGVLVSESDRGDPAEYLAALSALQRNYATVHRGRHAPDADLCDNTHCQRYSLDGVAGPIYRAVERGMRIELGSADALPCYYSVNCGGRTLTPREVWGNAESGYSSVICTSCRSSRWHRWTRSVVSTPAVERLMRTAPTAPFVDDDFKIRAGRAIGFNVVLSNTVDRIARHGRVYVVEGRGFGHRVGLCQDGARALARNGRDALQILRHYFPRTDIRALR